MRAPTSIRSASSEAGKVQVVSGFALGQPACVRFGWFSALLQVAT